MKTVLNVKTDPNVKHAAQGLAAEMGVPLSTIVNAYLKEFIVRRQFTVHAPLHPSQKLERLLRRVERDVRTGKNISKPFSTSREIDEHLMSL